MDLNRGPEPPTEPTLLVQPDILRRIDFPTLFGMDRPVEVELGSGDGSFLVHYAQRHPERSFLGVERLLGRLRKVERKGRRLGLENVRGIRLEAAYLVEWMLPESSVEAIHVYFPDPWPKRRHWRRRLVNHSFAAAAWKALRPGGTLYLRTDHPGYFQQMLDVLGACTSYRRVEEPAELLEVITDFERGFNARGIPTLHAAYQRPSDGQVWTPPPNVPPDNSMPEFSEDDSLPSPIDGEPEDFAADPSDA
jgi:tRNA (guanine-N7-)-methyltransferase